jgi:predicted ArsR family transcriptional regulator
MSSHPPWDVVQLLAEPTRRRVYETVRAADEPLTRDAVAQEAGVSRRLAAFHLELLAEAELLTTDYARPPGRTGPGAGRPAKRYVAAPRDIQLSVPARHYDIAARILARAISQASGGDVQAQAFDVAGEEGERIGALRRPSGRLSAEATLSTACDVLSDLGYEPQREPRGCVRLRNCPFHAVVDVNVDLVCGVNQHLVAGVLRGLHGHRSVVPRLDGLPTHCCVTLSRN